MSKRFDLSFEEFPKCVPLQNVDDSNEVEFTPALTWQPVAPAAPNDTERVR
jgi:hypothetical protein